MLGYSSILLCKANIQYLLTWKVSRYCLLALHDSIVSQRKESYSLRKVLPLWNRSGWPDRIHTPPERTSLHINFLICRLEKRKVTLRPPPSPIQRSSLSVASDNTSYTLRFTTDWTETQHQKNTPIIHRFYFRSTYLWSDACIWWFHAMIGKRPYTIWFEYSQKLCPIYSSSL